MTREEAIKYIKAMNDTLDMLSESQLMIALDMAIEALKIVETLSVMLEMHKQLGNKPTRTISMEALADVMKNCVKR